MAFYSNAIKNRNRDLTKSVQECLSGLPGLHSNKLLDLLSILVVHYFVGAI